MTGFPSILSSTNAKSHPMNNFDYMAWVIIPILIFIARLMDVSLATVRQILIMKGMRKLVPIIAFVSSAMHRS